MLRKRRVRSRRATGNITKGLLVKTTAKTRKTVTRLEMLKKKHLQHLQLNSLVTRASHYKACGRGNQAARIYYSLEAATPSHFR